MNNNSLDINVKVALTADSDSNVHVDSCLMSFYSAFLLIFLTLFVAVDLVGQNVLRGKVTDAENGQPLAFVNVVVDGGRLGAMTDIDGRYFLDLKTPIERLNFSYIGYSPVEVMYHSGMTELDVAMIPMAFELGEVLVEAGENPAHRIIDSVLRYRGINNPEHLDSYSYTIYDLMTFSIDSAFLQSQALNASAMKKMFDNNDIMAMETVSEVRYKAGRKTQEVVGNRISGLQDSKFVYLVNNIQSVSFYDEVINIMENSYVNPISRGSKSKYFFNLEEVVGIGDGDSLYVISFHPYRNTNFDGMEGVMTINSSGWALQNVKATPYLRGEHAMWDVVIQQLYERVEDHWFPIQLNTNISITLGEMAEAPPITATGKSYLSDIVINPELRRRDFSMAEIDVQPGSGQRDEAFWNNYRDAQMAERIERTHSFMDSISDNVVNFDRVFNFLTDLMTNFYLPVGCVDINLNKVANYSFSRKLYLGMGLLTNDRFSRHIRLDGYFGYWFGQKWSDYGGGVRWYISRRHDAMLQLRYDHNACGIGEFSGFSEVNSMLNAVNYKDYYISMDVRQDAFDATLSSRLGKSLKGFLSFNVEDKMFLRDYPFVAKQGLERPAERLANMEVRLRFAYKEKLVRTYDGIQSLGTQYPVLWFSYLRSFKGVLGGQYEFNRLQMQLEQNIYTKYYGATNILFQAGYVDSEAPALEIFNITGTWAPFGLYAPGSFATMREYEFFCTSFVSLFLTHRFGNLLWRTNVDWCSPEPSLALNMGWGTLDDRYAMSAPNLKAFDKGFYEAGIVLDNILNISYLKMGLGAFYRFGPYAYDRTLDNFAWKWNFLISL